MAFALLLLLAKRFKVIDDSKHEALFTRAVSALVVLLGAGGLAVSAWCWIYSTHWQELFPAGGGHQGKGSQAISADENGAQLLWLVKMKEIRGGPKGANLPCLRPWEYCSCIVRHNYFFETRAFYFDAQ